MGVNPYFEWWANGRNNEHAGKTVAHNQSQREIFGHEVHQQRMMMSFVNQKVNYQPPPSDENNNSTYSFKNMLYLELETWSSLRKYG
jgi:hypothetical protein